MCIYLYMVHYIQFIFLMLTLKCPTVTKCNRSLWQQSLCVPDIYQPCR